MLARCLTVKEAERLDYESCTFIAQSASDVMPTIHANIDRKWGSSQWVNNGEWLVDMLGVRRLTPVECERLQGFPDGYTEVGDKCYDGPRYKALGNSMAVPVMRWIGERIHQVSTIS